MDDTTFVREIKKQPDALRVAVDFYGTAKGRSLLADAAGVLSSKRKLVFTGMGTSLYAPYLIVNELSGIEPFCDIRDAGELLHFDLRSFRENDALIAISQSGESAETKQVVQKLRGKVTVVSIVNNISSYMGENSDFVLPLIAGNEASISTKTYTNTLAVLLLLSTSLHGQEPDTVLDGLDHTAQIMEENLEAIHTLSRQAVQFFGNLSNLHVVARGSDLVTARQCVLILKEGSGIFTEALSAGLFRHGPIELAGEGHSALFIVSDNNKPELTLNLAGEIAHMGSRVFVVSDGTSVVDSSDTSFLHTSLPFGNETIPSRLFPILCAPFIGFFVHETGKLKGKEAGIFRHATKITAKE
ncbi:MAG: SIS domain-containing protein [Candidatus Latescibacteria bacterium]|nr:SIS domain-containing protein [Candidatus Latescibacterota bacterium]